MAIPGAVLGFFASDPIGPTLSVARHAGDPTSPIHAELEAFLSAIPDSQITAACSDPKFQFLVDKTLDPDRAARVWAAEKLLVDEIPRQKLLVLREGASESRPRPYQMPALADLDVDADHLVPLSQFDFDGSRLLRNGHAFLPLSTTGAPNSTYWLLDAIYAEGLAERTRVRLDPFLFGPDAEFPAMAYRMWMYGRPLDWPRIESLRRPEHGRWVPGSLSRTSQFTDFVWDPRGSEIHFLCEEVPRLSRVEIETSR